MSPEAEALARALLSPKINGTPTDMREVPSTLARYCRPLLFYRQGSAYDAGYSGSSLLFRYNKRNFQLACEHQLRIRGQPNLDPAVSFLLFRRDEKPVGLSPKMISRPRFQLHNDMTLDDLVLLSFEDERDGHYLTPHFWEVDFDSIATLNAIPPEQAKLIFAIGFQTSASDYDPILDADGNLTSLHIVNRWAKLYLEQRPRGPLDDENRVPLQVIARQRDYIGDPDGFSGSPCFFLWRPPLGAMQIGFAGMVATANKDGRLALYPAPLIISVVKGLLGERDT